MMALSGVRTMADAGEEFDFAACGPAASLASRSSDSVRFTA
jgi:hypothetical protein